MSRGNASSQCGEQLPLTLCRLYQGGFRPLGQHLIESLDAASLHAAVVQQPLEPHFSTARGIRATPSDGAAVLWPTTRLVARVEPQVVGTLAVAQVHDAVRRFLGSTEPTRVPRSSSRFPT